MEKLVYADPFQKPKPLRFRTAEDEDRYYQSHEPRSHGSGFSIATMAVLAGCVAIALNLLPR